MSSPLVSLVRTKSESGELDKLIRLLTKRKVMVGIPSDTSARKPDVGENKAPPSNALIGYVMERGMPERNVPARPFLVPGVRDARERMVKELKKGAKDLLLKRDPGVVDRTLNIVGLVAQRSVQAKINSGDFQALAPSTIAGRVRRGRTGTKPLNDTLQMLQAVTYVITDK